ncbi:hypothetical protein EYF80_028342 [Liparis tanakae]|uniref:Uncharacterized protein n=1 Tax=Liparis tanakae TaxID=230148 RepID=A0A4Z2H8V5_9TELE|nr:hypothetical protein EYF80_028342 [Liparis tanakae]
MADGLWVSPLCPTFSGQMQEVCLHVQHLVLYDVAVELKHREDVLGELGGRGTVRLHQIAPVHHLAHHDTDHWRGEEDVKGRDGSQFVHTELRELFQQLNLSRQFEEQTAALPRP